MRPLAQQGAKTITITLILMLSAVGIAVAQQRNAPALATFGTGFTYQGQLRGAAGPVNAICDFDFALWSAAEGGRQVGSAQTISAVPVVEGLFTVTLNQTGAFGTAAFDGSPRWLAIGVQCPGDGGFTALSPRQPLTAAPYALMSGSTGAIQGRAVSATAPSAGQALVWDGGQWAPQTVQGDSLASGMMIITASRAAPAGFTFTGLRLVYGFSSGVSPWAIQASVPSPHTDLAAAAIDGKLYIVGGRNTGNLIPNNVLEVYDPETDSWSSRAPMPTARYSPAAAAIGGKLYVVGGQTSATSVSDRLEVYDPETNSWATKAPLPVARGEPGAGVIDGKLYVVGGWNGTDILDRLDVYDPETNSWATKAPLPVARSGPGAGVIDGKLYVVGGCLSGPRATDMLDRYDPGTDSWEPLPAMPSARCMLGAAVVGGKLYAVGGEELAFNNFSMNDLEVYDPALSSWEEKTPMPYGSGGLAAVAIGGEIYSVGGNGGQTQVYNPAVEPELYIHVKR